MRLFLALLALVLLAIPAQANPFGRLVVRERFVAPSLSFSYGAALGVSGCGAYTQPFIQQYAQPLFVQPFYQSYSVPLAQSYAVPFIQSYAAPLFFQKQIIQQRIIQQRVIQRVQVQQKVIVRQRVQRIRGY